MPSAVVLSVVCLHWRWRLWMPMNLSENVNMTTIEQMWLFSAGGRPGTKFYIRSPIMKSNLLFPRGEKNLMISPFQGESLRKILYQAYHMLKKVKSAQMSTCWHFQICRVLSPNKKLGRWFSCKLLYSKKKNRRKRQQISRQIWVNLGHKKHKNIFSEQPKSVNRKNKKSTDEQTEMQKIWFSGTLYWVWS